MPTDTPTSLRSLVARLADELRLKIESGALPPGTRMPSVRQLARERDISPFSAAEIYNALVAATLLEARPGSGYFVPNPRPMATPAEPGAELGTDSIWERRREASGRAIQVDAGCGWLPDDWLHGSGIRAALRSVARQEPLPLGYGNPLGLTELRAHVGKQLELRAIAAREDDILLTQGASQALDLIVRECLAPGDLAIVEDPGYPPLFDLLRQRGVTLLSLARTESGPDVDALAQLLKRQRARMLFTNTTFHNPTGTTTQRSSAHRILELADRHDVTIVEDDIFADLAPRAPVSLASLDALERVIYVSSFSKTLSPALRCGFIAARGALTQRLARAKVVSALGSSQLSERLVLEVLTRGRYRRHLKRLHERLALAQSRVAPAFEARGVEIAFRAQSGLFLWATLPSSDSVSKLWRRALNEDVLLAPGEMFRPDARATAHWRFNVAHCDAPALYRFLDTL